MRVSVEDAGRKAQRRQALPSAVERLVFGNLRIMGPHHVIDQVTDPLGGADRVHRALRQHGNDGSTPGTRNLGVTTELLDLAVDLQRAVLDVERRPGNERNNRAKGGLSAARLASQPENL